MDYLFTLFLAFRLLSAPSDVDAAKIARSLESRYQRAHTLKATFLEIYRDGNGGFSAESGIVYFSRPKRMRWEYESPQQKLFLVDGANAWFYVPADRSASRAKIKDSSDWRTPLALLAGQANVFHLCRSLEIVPQGQWPPQEKGSLPDLTSSVLRCLPRDSSDEAGNPVREILLEADAESRLVGLRIREAGGWEMSFRFANWEENIPIPEEKFHFSLPPGVSIVDEASLSAGQLK